MISCGQCGKEVSINSAILSQDLSATRIAFCSLDCHTLWINHALKFLANRSTSPETNRRRISPEQRADCSLPGQIH
jgi:hypothetical protein